MTDLDVYRPHEVTALPVTSASAERDVVDGWVQVVTKVAKLADMIADTEFVPKALRNKPAAITACMLTGREIGVGPMLSMKVIHMVNGTPSLAAEYKRGRALQAGHEIVYEETSITRCVVRGRRKNEDSWVTVTWTIDDARRAKLAGKDVWQQNPRRMLEARATGELCDLKFPDCSWGLATTEALQDGDAAEFAEAFAPAIAAPPAPPAAPRTARRRQPAADPTPVSAAGSAPAPGTTPPDAPDRTAPPARTNGDQPPLPGEDEPAPPKRGNGITGVIQAHFRRLGFTDDEREQRLIATGQIAGRDITSTNDLTPDEHKVVADTLARCRDREALITLLVAAGQDADAEASDG